MQLSSFPAPPTANRDRNHKFKSLHYEILIPMRRSHDYSANVIVINLYFRQVLTAYIDTTLPLRSRQKSLQETYNFMCCCNLCSNPPNPDPRESLWCPKSCGGSCPLPTEGPSDLLTENAAPEILT